MTWHLPQFNENAMIPKKIESLEMMVENKERQFGGKESVEAGSL